jgi:hypothetical protein
MWHFFWEKRNACRVLVGKHEEDLLEDLDVDGTIN